MPIMTRSTAASVRCVVATPDANIICASLASARNCQIRVLCCANSSAVRALPALSGAVSRTAEDLRRIVRKFLRAKSITALRKAQGAFGGLCSRARASGEARATHFGQFQLCQVATNKGKKDNGGNMAKVVVPAMFCLLLCAATLRANGKSVFDFTLNGIDGQPAPLAAYKGKVVMLVNVASRCGYTPQYTALESIYEKYKDRGFVIIGIPANNFGAQEPGTNQEIKTFCQSKYSVTFPMMSKVSVKGSDKTPLYQLLTDKAASPKTGGEIQWNFTKFLVGPDGQILARFEPAVTPDSPELTGAVEKALASVKN